MRIALVLAALLLGGCAGAYHTSSDGRLQTRIDNSYKARDACLAKNAAADGTMSLDAASVAQAAALACSGETERLIEVSNRDGDPAPFTTASGCFREEGGRTGRRGFSRSFPRLSARRLTGTLPTRGK